MHFFLKHKKISQLFPSYYKVGCKVLYTNLAEMPFDNVEDFLLKVDDVDNASNEFCETLKFVNDTKRVFRVKKNLGSGSTFIVKTFFFRKIRHRFQKTWRPLDELFNQIKARERRIPTPGIYGIYLYKDNLGLVKESGILMEDLVEFESLQTLFHKVSYSDKENLLETLSKAIQTLYYAGCHHIDLNLGAIMVNQKNYSDFRIIDFQHAQFYDVPSEQSFLFTISYISKRLRPFFEETGNKNAINLWIKSMIKTIIPSQDINYINKWIDFYDSHELRRKERVKIGRTDFWRRIKTLHL